MHKTTINLNKSMTSSPISTSDSPTINGGSSIPDSCGLPMTSLANGPDSMLTSPTSTFRLNSNRDVIAGYMMNYLASSRNGGPEVDAVTSALRLEVFAMYNGGRFIGKQSERGFDRLHRNDILPPLLLPAHNSTLTCARADNSLANGDVIIRRVAERSSDAVLRRGVCSGTKRSSPVTEAVAVSSRAVPWRPFVDDDDQDLERSRTSRNGVRQEAFLDVIVDEESIVRRQTEPRGDLDALSTDDDKQQAGRSFIQTPRHHQPLTSMTNAASVYGHNTLPQRPESRLVQFGTDKTPRRLPGGNRSNEPTNSRHHHSFAQSTTYLPDAAALMRPASGLLDSYSTCRSSGQHLATSTFWPRFTPNWRNSVSSSDGSPNSVTSSPSPGHQISFDAAEKSASTKYLPSSLGSFPDTPSSSSANYSSMSRSSSLSGCGSRPSIGHRLSSSSTALAVGDPTMTSSPLACCYCDKVYASVGALKMHIRTHTLPCRCPQCGKAFSRLWLLRGHLRTHTGERPFHCPDPGCRRAFADRSNLRAHLRTHANGTATTATGCGQGRVSAGRYSCTPCGKSFSRVSLLTKHEMSTACRRREMATR